jgi:hypothetical protein
MALCQGLFSPVIFYPPLVDDDGVRLAHKFILEVLAFLMRESDSICCCVLQFDPFTQYDIRATQYEKINQKRRPERSEGPRMSLAGIQ